MNILYINHYAGSLEHGMEFRPFYLSKIWSQKNHNVSILAASFSHVRKTQPLLKSTFQKEIIDGVNFIWCKTPSYKKNDHKRLINIIVFVFRIFQYIFNIPKLDSPNVVIASSTYPLDIFPAWIISKIYNAKLIFEVHDLWPLSPRELGGISKWHPFIIIMQFAEDFAYKFSEKVVSILPKTLDHMVSRGLEKNKFYHLPNGIDLSEWEENKIRVDDQISHTIIDYIKKDKKLDKFIIGYFGSHGVANCLDNFLEAAEILKDEKVNFYLIGTGPEKEKLIKIAEEKNLYNVRFFNPIYKKDVSQVLRYFDVTYIGLQKQPLFRFGICPNKIMDYMAAKKPIISAIEAGNDPVSEAGCGLNIPPENPRALADAILNLQLRPKEELNLMGERGFKFVVENHTYDKIAADFLALIENQDILPKTKTNNQASQCNNSLSQKNRLEETF